MAGVGIKDDKNIEVALRRFATQPLTGGDLSKIRTSLLRLTQEELGDVWGISRNQVSRLENLPEPDRKTCDAYLGLMVRNLLALPGETSNA